MRASGAQRQPARGGSHVGGGGRSIDILVVVVIIGCGVVPGVITVGASNGGGCSIAVLVVISGGGHGGSSGVIVVVVASCWGAIVVVIVSNWGAIVIVVGRSSGVIVVVVIGSSWGVIVIVVVSSWGAIVIVIVAASPWSVITFTGFCITRGHRWGGESAAQRAPLHPPLQPGEATVGRSAVVNHRRRQLRQQAHQPKAMARGRFGEGGWRRGQQQDPPRLRPPPLGHHCAPPRHRPRQLPPRL